MNFEKYNYYFNEKNGMNLPIPRGYDDAYKTEINQVMKSKAFKEDFSPYETVVISLNLTKNCNLACKYCFNKDKQNQKISYEDATKFIDLVIEATPNSHKYILDLAGSGEPLLEFATIIKLSDYCYNKSNEINKLIVVQFCSNGMLLNKEIVEALQKHSILFGVSLDGDKKSHDKNRVTRNGEKTYDRIMENVKNIAHREYLGVAATMTNETISVLKDIRKLSEYFSTISIRIARPDEGEALNYKKINKAYDKLALLLLKDAKKGDLTIMKKILNGDDFFGKFLFRIFANNAVSSRCDAGFGKFSLDSDLNIYTCAGAVGIENLKIGSLSCGINQELGLELQKTTIYNDSCQKCKFKILCGGECLVVKETSKGVANKELCEIKKHLMQLAIYLKGEFIFLYNDLYQEIMKFLEEKANRFYEDKDLLKVLKKNKEYTYMQLKEMKDHNDPKFKKLLNK